MARFFFAFSTLALVETIFLSQSRAPICSGASWHPGHLAKEKSNDPIHIAFLYISERLCAKFRGSTRKNGVKDFRGVYSRRLPWTILWTWVNGNCSVGNMQSKRLPAMIDRAIWNQVTKEKAGRSGKKSGESMKGHKRTRRDYVHRGEQSKSKRHDGNLAKRTLRRKLDKEWNLKIYGGWDNV